MGVGIEKVKEKAGERGRNVREMQAVGAYGSVTCLISCVTILVEVSAVLMHNPRFSCKDKNVMIFNGCLKMFFKVYNWNRFIV